MASKLVKFSDIVSDDWVATERSLVSHIETLLKKKIRHIDFIVAAHHACQERGVDPVISINSGNPTTLSWVVDHLDTLLFNQVTKSTNKSSSRKPDVFDVEQLERLLVLSNGKPQNIAFTIDDCLHMARACVLEGRRIPAALFVYHHWRKLHYHSNLKFDKFLQLFREHGDIDEIPYLRQVMNWIDQCRPSRSSSETAEPVYEQASLSRAPADAKVRTYSLFDPDLEDTHLEGLVSIDVLRRLQRTYLENEVYKTDRMWDWDNHCETDFCVTNYEWDKMHKNLFGLCCDLTGRYPDNRTESLWLVQSSVWFRGRISEYLHTASPNLSNGDLVETYMPCLGDPAKLLFVWDGFQLRPVRALYDSFRDFEIPKDMGYLTLLPPGFYDEYVYDGNYVACALELPLDVRRVEVPVVSAPNRSFQIKGDTTIGLSMATPYGHVLLVPFDTEAWDEMEAEKPPYVGQPIGRYLPVTHEEFDRVYLSKPRAISGNHRETFDLEGVPHVVVGLLPYRP